MGEARQERGPRCRFCGAVLKDTFVDLGSSPLANSYLTPAQLGQMEPFYPLHVRVCAECLLVQLPAVVSAEHIFSDYAYFSSYSDSWLQHAKDYADLVTARFGLNERSRVVEVASNDGYLLQYFVAKGIPVLGVEPAANVAEAAVKKGIPTVVKFFGEAAARDLLAEGWQANLIVGNNVLAHVPGLNDFVAGMKVLLAPTGVITMEFPHLMQLVDGNQFDTIYHEHFSYFSFLTVSRIFARHGLAIFDVEELPTHGGSLRIYAKKREDASKAIGGRVAALVAHERAAGYDTLAYHVSFAEKVKETKRNLLEFLIGVRREGKSVVGYGAPAKGNTLLNYCGIRTDFLDYTVDRSPHKQGHYLPGTHIPIYSPDRIRETKPDYLLILPWNLREEIMGQMAHVREWGGRFVVPIPEVRVWP
ncbi:MAG: methyltransferase domain-containing protein [Chloroflexota bacterium]